MTHEHIVNAFQIPKNKQAQDACIVMVHGDHSCNEHFAAQLCFAVDY